MTKWSIKSIKHWPDGTWDALLIKGDGPMRTYQRVVSEDGFRWRNKYNAKVHIDVQSMLTEAIGAMLDGGITYVVF